MTHLWMRKCLWSLTGSSRGIEFQWGSYFLAIDKGLSVDLAFELTAVACIIVDILM